MKFEHDPIKCDAFGGIFHWYLKGKKVYNGLLNEQKEVRKLKIVFTNRLTETWVLEVESLKKEFPTVEFITFKDVSHPRSLLETADAVVGGHFSDEEIEKAKNLKVIFVPWTGVNMLPWDVIKKKNITVTNTHANSRTVAERAVALCLALTGRIVEYHNDLSKGVWHGFPVGLPKSDFWTSIEGKTCAVVGLGNIGRHVAKMIKAFDCHVVGFKKHPIENLPENVDEVTTDLDDAISKSQIVFITIPLTNETKNMFNSNVFSKMKDKLLINVSRGEVVNEEALYTSLKNGILAGAAIDTWYVYPNGKDNSVLPSKYPIHTFKNVVLSPHVAGVTEENIQKMAEDTLKNVRSYLKNGKVIDKVNLNLMY